MSFSSGDFGGGVIMLPSAELLSATVAVPTARGIVGCARARVV